LFIENKIIYGLITRNGLKFVVTEVTKSIEQNEKIGKLSQNEAQERNPKGGFPRTEGHAFR